MQNYSFPTMKDGHIDTIQIIYFYTKYDIYKIYKVIKNSQFIEIVKILQKAGTDGMYGKLSKCPMHTCDFDALGPIGLKKKK